MATPADYEYRVLRIPRGTDIDGAIVELHTWPNGLVTMDIRIPARHDHSGGGGGGSSEPNPALVITPGTVTR